MRGRFQRRLDRGDKGLHLTVHDHRIQTFFSAKVLVDDRFGDACLRGCLLHGRTVETFLCKEGATDFNELLTSRHTAHPDSFFCHSSTLERVELHTLSF